MASSDDIAGLLASLKSSLDPNTPHMLRQGAYQSIESFKENSPHCISCAKILLSSSEEQIVKHFGLQILEHVIKYRWNTIPQEDKVVVKDTTFELLKSGFCDASHVELYAKDAVAKVIVEIAKREWPQQWPGMMQELRSAANIGAVQTEIVIMTLSRLAEDVVTFQTLPPVRRKEVLKGLLNNMADVFSFFIDTIKTTASADEQKQTAQPNVTSSHSVCRCCLMALCSYVDWVPVKHLSTDNSVLLQMLVLLLQSTTLRTYAAEALLLIVQRKGSISDRTPLLVFLAKDSITLVLEAARSAASSEVISDSYLFLKKSGEFLIALAQQIIFLWDTPDETAYRDNLPVYMNALIAFTSCSSQRIASYTLHTWASLLRHPGISQLPQMRPIVAELVLMMRDLLVKKPVTCQQERDDADELFNDKAMIRNNACTVVRFCAELDTSATLAMLLQWTQHLMQAPVDTGSEKHKFCSYQSPTYLQFDAYALALDVTLSKLNKLNRFEDHKETLTAILEALLGYDTTDAVILCCVLNCMQAAFPIVKVAPQAYKPMMDKTFYAVQFNPQQKPSHEWGRGVCKVRKESCIAFVRMCKHHPNLVMQQFDCIYESVQQMCASNLVRELEKSSLAEGLLYVGNYFTFEKHKQLIDSVMSPTAKRWLSADIQRAISTVDSFMTYIGVNQDDSNQRAMEKAAQHRTVISSCLTSIHTIVRTVKVPTSQEEAESRGYLNGGVISNPCAPAICSVLDNVLILIRTMNAMFVPSNRAKLHPTFQNAYDLSNNFKLGLLGKPVHHDANEKYSRNSLQRVQNFIYSTFEECVMILGQTSRTLGAELYRAPNLATSLMNSVLSNMDCLPDYKLRVIIRMFLKPFVSSCPYEFYERTVLRVVAAICPYMLERITKSWDEVRSRRQLANGLKTGGGGGDGGGEDESSDEEPEEEQVISDIHLTNLTRTYSTFIRQLCLNSAGDSANGKQNADDAAGFQDEDMADVAADATDDVKPGEVPAENKPALSSLCHVILHWDNIFPSVLLSAYNSLLWGDSPACILSIPVCTHLLRQLLLEDKLLSADACHLYYLILRGIQLYGTHETDLANLLTLALSAYELLRPKFPEVIKIMLQIPGMEENDLKMYEGKHFVNVENKVSKRKRDNFKALIRPIIPLSVGEQHKREITIADLAPILNKSKPRRKALVEILGDEDLGLCHLFQSCD